MPVILTLETEKLWLTGSEIMGFAKPEVELKAVEIYPNKKLEFQEKSGQKMLGLCHMFKMVSN